MFKAKGECSNPDCKNKYDLPCKDVQSCNTALKSVGWISGTKGKETMIACPLTRCHIVIEEWGAGVGQKEIDFGGITEEVVRRVNDGELDDHNVTVTAEKSAAD